MIKITNHLKQFIKAETVLLISGLMAVLSMLFVPPTVAYLAYIDFRVLGLLFCLMAVVAGFDETGIFLLLSEKLLMRVANTRSISFVLVMLCFLSSMWITNDVALITFVPFAILILSMADKMDYLLRIIVLQTIAANLGSMLTPVGNPQNLYLYSYYNVSIGEFFGITFPFVALSALLLCVCICFIPKEHISFTLHNDKKTNRNQPFRIFLYGALFLVCLACVLRFIDYRFTFLLVFFSILLLDRKVLRRVDYSLLLTFVFFFLFVGNIGSVPAVRETLAALLESRELFVSVLVSQLISNVPAAVLLSAFTGEYKALILGADLGGLGTLIASLASLISYKFYCRTVNAEKGRYLKIFTFYNLIFLAILSLFTLLL